MRHHAPIALLAVTAGLAAFAPSARAATTTHASSWTWGGGPKIHGSGHSTSDTRSAAGAHAVRSEGSIDVVVTLGDKEQVTVTADDNLLALVTTTVDAGTLVIATDGNYDTHLPMRADVILKRLDAVDVRGSGDLTAAASPGDFSVGVQGSGDVSITGLDAPKLRSDIAGSGSVTLAGRCKSLDASTQGSGDLRASQLACTDVSVSIAGSGDSDVAASGTLDATVAGSGDVRYAGSPKVTSHVMGSGSVAPR